MNYLAGKSKKRSQPLLGGSSHDLQVVSNYHGDRKSRRPGVVGPVPNGLFMAYKIRVTNYLYTNWGDPPSSIAWLSSESLILEKNSFSHYHGRGKRVPCRETTKTHLPGRTKLPWL